VNGYFIFIVKVQILTFRREFPFRKGGDERRRFLTKLDLRDTMYSITMLKTKAYKYRLYPT
jgi:hypothetical protein